MIAGTVKQRLGIDQSCEEQQEKPRKQKHAEHPGQIAQPPAFVQEKIITKALVFIEKKDTGNTEHHQKNQGGSLPMKGVKQGDKKIERSKLCPEKKGAFREVQGGRLQKRHSESQCEQRKRDGNKAR